MKDFKKIRKHRRLYRTGRWASRKFGWLIRAVRWLAHKLRFLRIFRFLNPFRYIKKLDWYIIKKFLGYYFFSIALIISIAIVFDFNENLSKFTEHHAPARAIIFDYYANFVPYFANLFSALFVFVAVILFTTKLASNSEIIAILASGVSFKRLLRPYMITCVLLSALSFGLSAYVIPHGTVIRQNFETMYKEQEEEYQCRECTAAGRQGSDCLYAALRQQHETRLRILSRQVPGQETRKPPYSDGNPVRHHFRQQVSLATEQLENPQAPGHEGAYYERSPEGHHHHDGTYRPGLFQGSAGNLHQSELRDYISKQINRGSGNVVQYEVEYHKRIASSFASFILTIIGVSLSARKRKGGMGAALGVGLALSFGYIMLQTVSATFAIQANFPPVLAAWLPNFLFAIVAYFCYRKAPR